MADILVLGVGNILFADEGLGVHMVHYLRDKYRFQPTVDVVDGGTMAYQLIDRIASYQRVLIVDAALMAQIPGKVYRFRYEDAVEWGWHVTAGAHETEVIGVLVSLKLMGELPDVQFIAMEPYDIVSTHIGLSSVVRDRVEAMEQVITEQLRQWGVHLEIQNDVDFDRPDRDLLDDDLRQGKEKRDVFGSASKSSQSAR
ncbi:MAG: HyaD/HybD family hydrogenase maturation endopeptidase [Sulfobacillus thermotolerans]|uniref:Hydrogenase maturation protease n=1 Tax=Sulfobacillus thermotolerans TaxID=338644 RepID=A0ABM6RTV7_9FIRM|nr:hydrogenase maturation protease [Sulfobacillus thermotolerans]MCY0909091.1 HyaD/HybD family hydrogenase maturation endopeptidase [Sulfobacillus thermotolerans]